MNQEPFLLEQASFLKLSLDEKVHAGISTRNGGVSVKPYESLNLGLHVGDVWEHVVENRRRLAHEIGFPLESWVCAEQVHGSSIHKVSLDERGCGAKEMGTAVAGTDGLYTREPGVLLSLGYADCVPLYFFARGCSIVGLAHAGWRGTTQNIAGNMIKRWVQDEKIPLEDIRVVIGPSIGPCCYEVDQQVIDALSNVLGSQADDVYRQSSEGHYRLDLKKSNMKLCQKEGISENHIECSSYCTGCQTDTFYSHRIEGGPTGRMMAYIGMHVK
ncbi:MAG TPA: peptidoglycan editing factor PgeF [Bacillales bacterium]|nr:peptidoglycan editing factor PgeF [Bacillales bacterium]